MGITHPFHRSLLLAIHAYCFEQSVFEHILCIPIEDTVLSRLACSVQVAGYHSNNFSWPGLNFKHARASEVCATDTAVAAAQAARPGILLAFQHVFDAPSTGQASKGAGVCQKKKKKKKKKKK